MIPPLMEVSQSNRIICVVGPTASGKTDLAYELATAHKGELVNADSKQIYQGFDIIPGKDLPDSAVFTPSELFVNDTYTIGKYSFDRIHMWLLDIVTPQDEFSVYDFVTAADPVIVHMQHKQKIPIIVGGSGFYIKALLDDVKTMSIPPDEHLRAQISDDSVEILQNRLYELNPDRLERMNSSDRANKRRLIRAIEIETYCINKPPVKLMRTVTYDPLIIGLRTTREDIKRRIDSRILARIQKGAIDEARVWYSERKRLSRTFMSINGIRPLFSYFDNDITIDRAIELWKLSEYLNAKKQMTWFDKDDRIHWFDIQKSTFKYHINKLVSEWIQNGT